MFICICMCIYIYIYIYVYTHPGCTYTGLKDLQVKLEGKAMKPADAVFEAHHNNDNNNDNNNTNANNNTNDTL